MTSACHSSPVDFTNPLTQTEAVNICLDCPLMQVCTPDYWQSRLDEPAPMPDGIYGGDWWTRGRKQAYRPKGRQTTGAPRQKSAQGICRICGGPTSKVYRTRCQTCYNTGREGVHQPKPCAICATMFHPKGSSAKYCSAECRRVYHRSEARRKAKAASQRRRRLQGYINPARTARKGGSSAFKESA